MCADRQRTDEASRVAEALANCEWPVADERNFAYAVCRLRLLFCILLFARLKKKKL